MEHPFFINSGLPINRSEALRFLSIAENLLSNRDLVGSKSFATRARESDPTFAPVADQILGIVDTLNAGNKRINNHQFDYYSILQIPPNQTQNADFIAEQYRQFNLLMNPQSNNFPFSDQAFRLVVDAFTVLSDPLRKSMYDKELGFLLNPYPVVASTPTPVHQSVYPSMPSSNADQMFENLFTQDQGSHAAGVSFSRDPQAGFSMPVTFLTHEQETVISMESLPIEQQLQQSETFLKQQTQPVTPISFLNTDEQPTSFFSVNQPQLVTSVRSLNRENPPSGTEVSSTQGREPVVCAEQCGSQQPLEKNENVVGNNANKSASTGDNVKEKEGNVDASGKSIPSFWTACPYCLFMHDYSVDYTHCTLRCQNCKKAFQAVPIASPPPIIDEPVVCAEQCGSQQPLEKNENVAGNNANKSASTGDNVKEKEGNVDASGKSIPSFWTACPYCLFMYEYSVDYTHCTLRCQNCKKAFQAVPIASPPPIIDGKKRSFCCWGFMPFGSSLENFHRNIDNASSWSPFSPMFTCSRFGWDGGSNVNNHAGGGQSNVNNLGSSHNAGGSKSGGGRKHFSPVICNDDDVLIEASQSSEESNVDWNRNKERKKAKNGKRKCARTGTPSKNAKKQQADKEKTVEGNNDVNLQYGLATQGGVEIPML